MFIKKITNKLDSLNLHILIELFSYGIVSVLALAVDCGGLLFLKEELHLNYITAATISFLLGLIVNYTLSRKWVFKKTQVKNQFTEFLVFGAVGLTGLILNDIIIWLVTEKLALFYFISKIIATAIVFFWNFFLRKFLLYR